MNDMLELEHVGIAVDDALSSLAMIADVLRITPYKSESLESDKVRTHFLRAGAAKLELLEPLDSDSPIARFISKRGPGLHHLAFEVHDIHDTHDRLVKAGFRVLDDAPRRGADGKLIFFVHPGDTGGVLFEFCRRDRSLLEDIEFDAGDRRFRLRRAGMAHNPPVLIADGDIVDVELLAATLEQCAYVLVTTGDMPIDGSELLDAVGLDRVHVAASTRHLKQLNLPLERLRSTIVFVDEDDDEMPDAGNVLIAASPNGAAAAARLLSKANDAGIVVADDELMARAIRSHIDTIEGPGGD